MRYIIVGIGVVWCSIVSCQAAHSDGPEPTCANCPGTYISANEISEYLKKAIAERRIDQQVRDVDIGKAHVAIGFVHRGKLDAPLPYSVAEHDQVSEVYHVIDGSGALVLGPDLIDKKRRPADEPVVRFINGPGNNAASIRNGETFQLKAGDVVVIPAGTGHWFTKIDDHIDYLMIRIDPDKVTPLRDERESRDYLQK
jgi:mannose-6-phosphate isomerase-like protein (cupin superfamily)